MPLPTNGAAWLPEDPSSGLPCESEYLSRPAKPCQTNSNGRVSLWFEPESMSNIQRRSQTKLGLTSAHLLRKQLLIFSWPLLIGPGGYKRAQHERRLALDPSADQLRDPPHTWSLLPGEHPAIDRPDSICPQGQSIALFSNKRKSEVRRSAKVTSLENRNKNLISMLILVPQVLDQPGD
jgi:hypothetical protein